MPRGGARPGAGRKRKPAPATPAAGPVVDAQGYKTDAAPEGWPFGMEPPAAPAPPEDLSSLMPLDYLLQVMRNPEEDKARRMTAATIAAPYVHPKKGEVSKKAEAADAAKAAAGSSKYATRRGPQLAAAGGKRVP